jgi:hypothetical protein
MGKPQAYRNIAIFYEIGSEKYWTMPEHNCRSTEGYKFLASSHVGAQDYLPGCRFLPDLIPIFDALYTPDDSDRPHCVSYIKHAEQFNRMDFGRAQRQSLRRQYHPLVLWKRKSEATVVIDNVHDGHYGLAGCEALSLGLPCIVFLESRTKAALEELAPGTSPFIEVGPSPRAAALAARSVVELPPEEYRQLRRQCRLWTERYYRPEGLVAKYWDPFFDALLSPGD